MRPKAVFRKIKRRRLWPDRSGCLSCGTVRRFRMYRGYCTRCYPLIRKGAKNSERELEGLHELEAPVKGGASGSDIENLLIAIAENIRAKPEKLCGICHIFDGGFDAEQRRRVYEVVLRLAENLPNRRCVQQSFVMKQHQSRETAEWNSKVGALD